MLLRVRNEGASMPDFIVKATGARVSEAAKNGLVDNGADPKGFVAEGTAEAAAATGGPPTRVLRDDEDAIFVSSGARISGGARLNRIATGVNKPSDFAVIDAPVAAVSAVEVAPAPAPTPAPATPAGPTPSSFRLPSGLILTPEGAANYVARGLCTSADLTPVTAEAVVAPAAAAASTLPINADDFTRAQLGAIAEALGLDNNGSKAILAAAINAHGDAAGTATAIAAL